MEGHNLRVFQKTKNGFGGEDPKMNHENSISGRKSPKRMLDISSLFFPTAEQIYKTVETYVVLMNQKRFSKIAI
jgi:hypothetical protein